jgi:DNA integrity scanning protein DisA with diadenylate cyclase activity/mannitol/fructose-specific phosphotransferase system IIA component (Ntr-type)
MWGAAFSAGRLDVQAEGAQTVDLVEVVNAMRIVELSAKTRPTAIRALAQATSLDNEGVSLDALCEAIEEREATAQTIVDEGFAMPHAIIDWEGGYRVVLGRSKSGVDYGIPDAPRVHLMALFVVGRGQQKDFHLQLLAALAELLESDLFRKELVEARDTRAIEQLLEARAGLVPERPPRRLPKVPRINTILVRQAIQLIEAVSAQALLLAVDKLDSVPWEPLGAWEGRLLLVTALTSDELRVDRPDTHLFDVPHATLTRMDRANLGLLLASSTGLLSGDASVVCVTGPGGRRLDSLTVAKPEAHLEAMFGGKSSRQSANIRPAVILRALSIAIELAAEGREGQPVGAMFVIGDSRQVMRHAHQLVLNPFHGFSRSLRSLLDPSLGETIKEFAHVDGAFVVQADGIVLSAGTYLVPKATPVRLPSGLGTRHQAAAGITAHTQATAITVSQSTGTVTVFRHGQIVLKLERAMPTRS